MASICFSCRRTLFRPFKLSAPKGAFSTTTVIQSGHSKWSTIKHDKARNDAAKSKQRTVLLNDISKATELFGPDPSSNPRLALAITKAKRASCPRDTIEAALARGQGLSPQGVKLEAFVEEAMLPSHSLALLIECLTDSKGKTRLEVRNTLKDHDANIASTAYLFSKKGHLKFGAAQAGEGKFMECAIDAGAVDVYTGDGGGYEVLSELGDITKICEKLKVDLGLDAEDVDIIWLPNSASELPLKDMEKDQPQEVRDLLEKLRQSYSVRGVYLTLL